MSVRSVSIRIEEEMLRKIAYVADYEGRLLNFFISIGSGNSPRLSFSAQGVRFALR